MKTKWAITTIFILAVVIVSTPAFASRYGDRGRHHFGGNRYRHHYGNHRYKRHFGNHRYRRHFGHNRYYRHPYYFGSGAFFWSPPPPVYIYREYPETIIYRENYIYGSQQSDYLPPRSPSSSTETSCLQPREYTTTMVIEGKTVEAYGTKCLQPDGSWRYGPAQPVPDS
jgi:hypothetical protein